MSGPAAPINLTSDPATNNTLITLNYIQSSLEPTKQAVMPPNLHEPPAFIKSGDIWNAWGVDDTGMVPPTVIDGNCITTQSGGVMFFPQRSANSMWRFSRIPATYQNSAQFVFSNSGSGTGISLPYLYPPGWSGPPDAGFVGNANPQLQPNLPGVAIATRYSFPDTFAGMNTLQYDGQLAIPYTANVQFDQILIEPDFSLQFSQTKLISGVLSMVCETISAGTITLNGNFSGSIIADTTEVAQQGDPGSIIAYGITNTNQASITRKDVMVGVASDDGVMTLVGPDAMRSFSQPNADIRFRTDGSTEHVVCTGPTAPGFNFFASAYAPGDTSGAGGPGDCYVFLVKWVTPWHTHWTTNAPSTPNSGPVPQTPAYTGGMSAYNVNYETIKTQPINEAGCLRIHYQFRTALKKTSNGDASQTLHTIFARALHVFATCDHFGAIRYNNIIEMQSWKTGVNNPRIMQYDAYFDASNMRGNYTSTGKYIGTLIQVGVINEIIDGASEELCLEFFDPPQMWITATTLNIEGEAGPCHLLLYNDFSNTTKIQCKGIVNVAGVSEARLAPYVQTAISGTASVTDVNIIPLMYNLYNSYDLPIRRNWVIPAYRDFIKEQLQKLTLDHIAQWASQNKQFGAMASGFFGNLLHDVSQGVKALGGVAGQALSSVTPGIAQALMSKVTGNSTGQFGSMSPYACGQFGASGQFGAEAAGIFGRQTPAQPYGQTNDGIAGNNSYGGIRNASRRFRDAYEGVGQ